MAGKAAEVVHNRILPSGHTIWCRLQRVVTVLTKINDRRVRCLSHDALGSHRREAGRAVTTAYYKCPFS